RDLDLGAERGQGDRGGRRVDDRAEAVAEDRVVVVLAVLREAVASALLQAVEVGAAEIPAARALEEVAAERRRLADVRRRGMPRRVGERRIAPADERVEIEMGEGRERADR